ncbi:hypothetical protein Gpo141_00000824 [Globisporangium polare]
MGRLHSAWRAQTSLATTTFSRLLFLLVSLLCLAPMQTANALSNMGNAPPKVDQRPFIHSGHHGMKSHQSAEAAAAGSSVIPGVCYSPFHNPEYPLGSNHPGNVQMLGDAMYKDFVVIKDYFSVARTYYSSYYGVPVTPAAAANGVKLYLGVYMTDEAWYNSQVDDAVNAVKSNPDTIIAILVGNENVQPAGPYTAKQISDRVTAIRARVLGETGRNVPVGTVQRATEWLESGDRAAIAALAANCDIIGVNIYPFFDTNYNAQYPLAILDGIWDKMRSMYPVAKLRLTEVGYPTAGAAPPSYTPNNIPSLANAKAFYNAFRAWSPSQGGGEAFWFMMFDRSPDDTSMGAELETYFGFFTWQRSMKDPSNAYPVAITSTDAAYGSGPTPQPLPPVVVPAGVIPTKVTRGVCYSPFHNQEYPLGSNHPGDLSKLGGAISRDFTTMKGYFSVVRTYYSSYYGIPVTPIAAAIGVKLYLGVYMTDEAWYNSQVDDAVNAVKSNPDTIIAILVGNENVQPAGPYTAKQISDRVTAIRARVLGETGRNVPVGTVQRATEWLESGDRAAIAALAANCDIIGVNIYPFFDTNYNAQYPLAILDGIWDKMRSMYPVAKLRLTEVGYPTAGAAPTIAPNNIPSLANAKAFYNAFVNWSPSLGGGEAFWFMMFDRSPDDTSVSTELERYFGFYDAQGVSKAAGYPILATAQTQPASSVMTTTVTTPVAPAPTTNAPVTGSSTITIPSVAATNVCRVKKLYLP